MIIHNNTTTDLPNTVKNPDTKTQDETELDALWKVVVYNDPVNLMNYVTHVFQKVFGYTKEKAEKHMLQVHEDGLSVVWTGNREKAEHFTYQLQSWQLRAKLEQD